jgi:tRNA nucleotidyltransferase (CCA-adding enzyme)
VIGLISKQVVEKAVRHGLKDSLIKEYMTTEFSVVSPDVPFSHVQELIIGQNQSLLPVIEKDRLVGTISVGDVMRVLQEEMVKSVKGVSVFEGQPLYARKKMISKLMKERFPEHLHNLLMEFGRVGDELGYSVYAVGGFVRDLLMRILWWRGMEFGWPKNLKRSFPVEFELTKNSGRLSFSFQTV